MSQRQHGIATGLILVGGLALFVGFSKGLDTLAEQREPSEKTEQPDFYQQALNYGWQAAVAAQTAKTSQEWEIVSSLWSQAIGKLQSVPKNNPNYVAVRQKISEYRIYREYAQLQQQSPSLPDAGTKR